MARTGKKPKQGPPVVFRPGPDLEQLIGEFASERKLMVNDAYKALAALAIAGLDVRHHDLLSQMATLMTGPNKFVRAALQIRTALQAAMLVAPQSARDPARIKLVISIVVDRLGGKGIPTGVLDKLRWQFGLQDSVPVITEQSLHSTENSQMEKQKIPVHAND